MQFAICFLASDKKKHKFIVIRSENELKLELVRILHTPLRLAQMNERKETNDPADENLIKFRQP